MNKHDTISLQYSQRCLRNVKYIVHASQRLIVTEVKLEVSNSPF